MASFSLTGCLDKMNNRDKDFRYMALSDLLAELEKDTFKMDNDSEKKIVSAIIKLLDDTSGDVQGLAVKCLGPLMSKIKEQQIQEIVDTLTDHVTQNKKETLRDIAGMGFKPVIGQIDPKNAPILVKCVPKLITAINEGEKQVASECLSVLSDLLGRFATQMTSDHEKIQKAILPQLTSTTAATRKKAISCLGYLSISTPDDLFSQLVTFVLKGIKDSKKNNHIRTLISVIGAISRSVGYRLGKFLESEGIINLLVKYLNDEQFENDDELKENCFQTFESLILRCPKEIKPYINIILKQCLKYIQWDPNMASGSGDDEEEPDDFSGDEEMSAEDFSDDDDMSWKVRRSSAKCITSIITTRPDLLGSVYVQIIPAVVSRFKEREEPVKLDVFEIFISALRQTIVVSRGMPSTAADNPINALKDNVGGVVANLTKELKSKSLKTKTGVFQLLKELVAVHPGLLTEHFGQLVPGIKDSLDGKNTNSNLKIEVLTFLSLAISTHPPTAFHKYIGELTTPVLKAVADGYYKITAEALRVTRGLVKVMRPHEGGSTFDYKPYAKKIYDATLPKYEAQDIDQEVKESAITCVGSLIAHMGDELPAEARTKALGILLERLRNEITRLTTVNVLIEVATSPLNIKLGGILGDVVSELADYLRQTSRQLKQACLKALDVLIRNYGKELDGKLFTKVLKEASNLIGDTDLHMSHLSLRLVEAIIKADQNTIAIVQSDIYPKIITLVQSSLLQGLALESLFSLYSILVGVNAKKFGFDDLLSSLLGIQLKSSTQTKQSQTSIAQCVAAICVSAPTDKRDATIERFVSEVKKSKTPAGRIQALLCLAEVGRRVDLSSHKGIQKTVLSAFDGSEDERNAASFCLGCISVGNISTFLPFVLSEIKSEPSKQYLLMHSLKEIISRASTSPGGTDALLPHLEPVLHLLFENTESEEEGTRNVVAECLGKFTLISPKQLVPALRDRISSKSPNTRSTVVTAVKFAVTDKPHPVDDILAPIMGDFLKLLSDADLNVRRATLLTLNFAAHNKPGLVRPVLPDHLNALYEETKVKPELIKVVDLGPFKHKVDTGLENRKAAFECMYTLLETCIDKIDISTFIEHVVNGLADTYDIKLLCQLMLVRLAQAAGAALLTSLDSLVEPFKKTITTKVKESAVQQEVEKNEEMIRSALRAIAAIAVLPDVDSAIKFSEFIKSSVKTGPHAAKYEEILKSVQAGTS